MCSTHLTQSIPLRPEQLSSWLLVMDQRRYPHALISTNPKAGKSLSGVSCGVLSYRADDV